MKNTKKLKTLLVTLLPLFAYSQADTNYYGNKIYFKLRNDVNTVISLPTNDSTGSIFTIFSNYGVTKLERPFSMLGSENSLRIYRVTFTQTGQINNFISDLLQNPDVEYAEKIPVDRISQTTPNDPFFTSTTPNFQWGLKQINPIFAWGITMGNPAVRVAIVDNAIDVGHVDLINKIIPGFDVADGDPDPRPPIPSMNHGTHVAGIAGAETNNAIEIASIGRNISIMPVKVTEDALASTNAVSFGYEGIIWAALNGADVINCSWGSTGFSQAHQTVIDDIFNQFRGQVIIVGAAGNNGQNIPAYPAAYNHVISVGATGPNSDAKASFSNFHTTIDVMAPGADIYSALPGNNYGYMSGTSMAAPMVAGLCGLMISLSPNIDVDGLENCLRSTCDNIDVLNPLFIGNIGGGRINAFNALLCIENIFEANFTFTEIIGCPEQPVQFTDMSITTVPVATRLWTFPPGCIPTTSNLPNPSVLFPDPGTYIVSLDINDGSGRNSNTGRSITIVEIPPTATVTGIANSTVCFGDMQTIFVQFTGTPPFSITFVNLNNIPFVFNTNLVQAGFQVPAFPENSTLNITSANDAFCNINVSGNVTFNVVQCCPNLFTNGNFEQGNTGFSSEQTFSQSYSDGNYTVGNFTLPLGVVPNQNHPNWPAWGCPNFSPPNCGNFLPNRGNNMMIDGRAVASHAASGNNPAYTELFCQNVNLINGLTYYLGISSTSTNAPGSTPLNLQFSVSAATSPLGFIPPVFNIPTFSQASSPLPPQDLYWNNFQTQWMSTIGGTARVCICQVNNFSPGGFDYIIDDVFIRPRSAVSANAGNDVSVCAGGCAVIGTPAQPNTVYNWIPITGLNNAGIAQPNACPAVTTTYTVIVLDPLTGCEFRDEVVVTVDNNCCFAPFIFPPTLTNTTVNQPVASIAQNLDITGAVTIVCPDLRIAGNAVIRIRNGATLTITNSGNTFSHLYACNEMWAGFLIEPSGSLIINGNTLVEDAINAITCQGAGHYTIDNAIFNRNRNYILIAPQGPNPFNGTVKQSVFTCRQLPPSPTATSLTPAFLSGSPKDNLRPPFSGNRGHAGMHITSVNGMAIGNPSAGIRRNIFDNLAVGIRAFNSTIDIHNNTFQNITSQEANPCPPSEDGLTICPLPDGVAIWLTGNSNTASLFRSNIGLGAQLHRRNSFTACSIGVRAEKGYNLSLRNNIFTDGRTGVEFFHNKQQAFEFYNNTFSNYSINGTGILGFDNMHCGIIITSFNTFSNSFQGISLFFQPNSSVRINNNRFTNSGNGTAITLSEPVPILLSRAEITGNAIHNYQTGIRGVNISEELKIISNRITTAALPFAAQANVTGIQVESCNNSLVQDNQIIPVQAVSAGNADRLRGINIEMSPSSTLSGNKLTRMGSGIRCFGNMPTSALTCNTMTGCHRGISLISATIGSQIIDINLLPAPSDNQWLGTPSGGLDIFSNLLGNPPLWYWRNLAGNLYNPSPFTPGSITPNPLNSMNYPFNCPSICIGPTCIQKQLADALQVNSYPAFTNENTFLGNEYVYKKLRNDNSLMNQSTPEDTLLRNFYQINFGGNLEKFSDVNDYINNGNMQQAMSANASVSGNCKIEDFQKDVNGIFTGSVYANQTLSSIQYKKLMDIANHCPMLGGRSVYGARSILRLFGENEFSDNCPEPALRTKPGEQTLKNDEKINHLKLYPNPNNGNMYLDYTLSENEEGVFIIYDLTGRKIAEYSLSQRKTTLAVSEGALQNGIYFYQVTINGKIIIHRKLSVIK